MVASPETDAVQPLFVIVFNRPRSGKRLEHSLACTTNRTTPILRGILELGSLRHFAFTVTPVRVVNTTTIYGLTLIHFLWFRHGELLFGCMNTKLRTFADIPETEGKDHGFPWLTADPGGAIRLPL